MTERPTHAKLLSDCPFRALWLAQLVSQWGDAVFDVTILCLAFTMTNSTAILGFNQAAVLLLSMFVSPVAGMHADMGSIILPPDCQLWTPTKSTYEESQYGAALKLTETLFQSPEGNLF